MIFKLNSKLKDYQISKIAFGTTSSDDCRFIKSIRSNGVIESMDNEGIMYKVHDKRLLYPDDPNHKLGTPYRKDRFLPLDCVELITNNLIIRTKSVKI
jgi:hypothetical protein